MYLFIFFFLCVIFHNLLEGNIVICAYDNTSHTPPYLVERGRVVF